MSDTDPRQPGPGPLHAAAASTELAQAAPKPVGAPAAGYMATLPASGCAQLVTGCRDQEPGARQ